MAVRSLGSLVRGAMRTPTCSSSPGIAVLGGAARSAVHNFQAPAERNAVFHVHGLNGRHNLCPAAVVALSAFTGSRGLHTRGSLGSPAGSGARRLHVLSDVVPQRAHDAFAAVAVFCLSVGIVYGIIKDTDESDKAPKEDTPTRTELSIRSDQLFVEMKRESAAYNKTIPDEKAVIQEYMEADQAMRARFEEWMKEYGRTYKDEVEKARRFKIFRAVARSADASTAAAVEAGRSTRFGLNEFSDWNKEEMSRLYGVKVRRGDGGYLQMVMSYLAPQEIWHQVASTKNKKQRQTSED